MAMTDLRKLVGVQGPPVATKYVKCYVLISLLTKFSDALYLKQHATKTYV